MKLSEMKHYALYASIALSALLLFILLISELFFGGYLFRIIIALLALVLITFGICGLLDAYATPYGLHNKLPLIRGSEIKSKEGAITFVVRRFDSKLEALKEQSYNVKTDRFSTVLSGLLDIKAQQDPTLSVRYSCRMGICGSCGVVINGKPALACESNSLECAQNGKIEVSPMLGHPLLKDLVTDFDDFFEKHEEVSPYLFRNNESEKYTSKKDLKQSKADLEKFLPYSYCIMCGLCLDACPVVNTKPEFIGPQALAQVYRYYNDSRDQMSTERLKKIDSDEGAWGCEFSGSCSKACPKGVDPASAIQMLKIDIAKNKLSEMNES